MTDSEEGEQKDMKYKLASSFHTQFAQNQNHHQMAFLQIISLLLTVFIGYGYLYEKIIGGEDITLVVELIYLFLMISCSMLTLGMALVLNMGYCFRRDQLATCLIRRRTEAMTDNDANTLFSNTFDPINKRGLIAWLPGFQSIFFVFLFILKLFLLIGVIFGTKTRVYVSNESNFIITSSVAISCMSIVFDVGMFNWYRCKWIDYSNVWKNKFYNISRIDGR
jgi:hypothetical protein